MPHHQGQRLQLQVCGSPFRDWIVWRSWESLLAVTPVEEYTAALSSGSDPVSVWLTPDELAACSVA